MRVGTSGFAVMSTVCLFVLAGCRACMCGGQEERPPSHDRVPKKVTSTASAVEGTPREPVEFIEPNRGKTAALKLKKPEAKEPRCSNAKMPHASVKAMQRLSDRQTRNKKSVPPPEITPRERKQALDDELGPKSKKRKSK